MTLLDLENNAHAWSSSIGLGKEEVREETIRSKVLRVTNEWWEMDADQRHADIIVYTYLYT